ncbi:laminin subunit alpha-2 [Strongylocentrotus purpuratus]|uniref:Laminin subunit alpha-2 n=1 Tax=Strongylocentrotus purpuratus TaxID=7668 RepID=A0A7M7SXZ8_STRPU|nr:laminin subunit alpha-2 [Strongylocentrotus purpuratus]
MQYHWVTITLDLGQIYQVAYVIVKAANSPRPGNWILERSLDGEMYKPWQYFAISESECVKEYGIVPSRDMHRFSRDDEVSCTSLYSKLEPLENGEIHTSIINGRPTATNPSQVLIDFTSARFIRLRLQQIRTLHADLMTFNSRGIRYVDTIVSRRYYYSIKDISIGGQCICFGHAEQCVLNPSAGPNDLALKCICEHNTCGDQCNQCCRGFQQFPWRPGNTDFGNSCRPCNCHGHADDCYYDAKADAQSLSIDEDGNYNGGGVCVACRDNTDGLNCQTCRDGFYRPLGVEPTDPSPCRECRCSAIGTQPDSNNNCVKDERSQVNDMNPGDCFCKEGYAGPSCDRCARGYRGYPDCEKCLCSNAGSSNEDPCEGPCVCKPNVEGSNCDVCKRGFFNLAGDNSDGCGECYCFGITTECTSVPWGIEQVTTLTGWFVTNVERSSYAFPDTTGVDMLSINHYKALEDLGDGIYYWLASREYLGNKLSSHGGYLTFTVSYSIQRGDVYQQPTRDADIVIEGDRLRLYQSFLYIRPEEERTARIQMAATNWFVLTPDVDLSAGVMGRRATPEEFMRVLSDVRALLIRASYNTRPIESRLKNVVLEEVQRTAVTASFLASVEQCECPPTYEGFSCESCEYGYRRVNNALYGGVCERCDCNNHSPECDPYMGECSQCDHNTYGPHCESCLPGFYGDATSGLADACQPCACPREDQGSSFSPTCIADDRYGFVCNQCATGHGGPRCDKCVDGFYGDPMTTGLACRPCSLNCNGNLDTSSPGSCDTYTGACLLCREGSVGDHCQRCALGFYGDAIQRTCQACQCHEAGSLYPQCDEVTGSCQCRSNVTGRQCDTCSPGHFNLSTRGCQSCDCHPTGSLDDTCDVITGQCSCKLGVSGRLCDQCMAGFWNFGENGCQSCECEQSGGLCDSLTGQCGCPANVIGQRCDSCAPETWGYNSVFGCKPCNCSDVGSSSQQCDLITGQCRCYKSYEGRQCNSCGFGYYGYPKCRKCRCSRRGRDPSTCRGDLCDCNEEGNCMCKANIQGKKCSKCSKGSFSLQPKLPSGCTSCFCFGVSEKCDQADYIISRIEMAEEDASELFVSDANRLRRTQTGVTHYSAGGGVNITAAQVALRTRDVYWNLPPVFLGNMVTAYGGMIKYKIDYTEPKNVDGWSEARPYLPHIMLVGEVHSLVIPVSNLNGKSRPKLELFEYNFLHLGTGDAPTREEFMMVLQDVQAILVPAAQTYQTISSRISSVYMEVGAPRGNDTTSLTVLGIEECKCPKGYRGTSCEECMTGYVRVQEGPYLGRCELCTCHKHSDVCNDGNGKCQDCQHNTTGSRCHLCAPGFYGDATRGQSDDCQPCGCPLNILSNNFSPLCETAEDGGYICTACPRGYSGRYCERCAVGYYGNPLIPGGSCHPCGCNEYGSNTTVCNGTTGQCHCIAGVSGRSCDECSPRHVITGDGCTSCDDGCTGPLLDALDKMRDDVKNLNTSRFIPPPWPILMGLTDDRNQLQDQVDSYNRAVIAANELIASLPNGTNDLSAQTRRLMRKLDNDAGGIELVAMNASDVTLRARQLNEQVNATYKLINETVALFKDQFLNQGLVPARENAQLINRATGILEELRDRTFVEMQVAALEERRLANLTLDKTSNGYAEMLRDLYAKIGQAMEDLNDLVLKLDELLIRCRMADRISKDAFDAINSANDSLNAFQNMTGIIQEKKQQSESDVQDAERLLQAAQDLLRMANNTYQTSEAEHGNLSLVLPDLVLRSDQSDIDLMVLGEDADMAMEHAIELYNRSVLLENLLLPTQQHAQGSLEAERAYSDIVTAINEAHNASLKAKRTADEAHKKAYANDSRSLSQQAKDLKDKGFNQLQQTLSLEADLQTMTSELAGLRGQVEEVNAIQDEASQGLDDIKQALPPLEQDIASDAQRSINSSMRATNMATKAADRSARVTERAAGLKEKLDGIGGKYQAYINVTDDIANSVEASAGMVDEMGMKMGTLRNQALHIETQRAPMELNLRQLRDKIRHARTEASRINVALLCRGDCARSYRPRASSTAFNALVLNINISGPNNMIFYVGNNITGDYLAVETIEGQVRLSWDLGSGRGEVVHPSNLSANQDWYRINIERFANTASLKVEDSSQAKTSNGSTVTGVSPEGRNVLDVREDSNLFIAGIPPNFDIPELSTKSFNGSIGEVIFDDVAIGLWNFKTSQGPGEGSFRSPIMSTSTAEPGAYFDGTGYAKLRQPPLWDEYINSLNFDIKTLSENGLLFYSASEDQVRGNGGEQRDKNKR